MNETLRQGETITKVTNAEAKEIESLTLELTAIMDLLNVLVIRQKAARRKLSSFWRRIGEEYFIDIKTMHHIDIATHELRKGKPT